jgi:hypothetical protein
MVSAKAVRAATTARKGQRLTRRHRPHDQCSVGLATDSVVAKGHEAIGYIRFAL